MKFRWRILKAYPEDVNYGKDQPIELKKTLQYQVGGDSWFGDNSTWIDVYESHDEIYIGRKPYEAIKKVSVKDTKVKE